MALQISSLSRPTLANHGPSPSADVRPGSAATLL
jgi:hypothetical protein